MYNKEFNVQCSYITFMIFGTIVVSTWKTYIELNQVSGRSQHLLLVCHYFAKQKNSQFRLKIHELVIYLIDVRSHFFMKVFDTSNYVIYTHLAIGKG